MTESQRRPTALVTGASSGIGLELARLLAEEHDLVLVAQNRERLERVGAELQEHDGVSVRTWAKDLSTAGAAAALWREVADAGIGVDVLVNNAGVGYHGALAQQDTAALDTLVALNVSTLTSLTRLALPPMIGRRFGRILNVASIVAFQPGGPQMAAYYATKAFVLSLSRGLARELRGTGVRVTALCPGATRTEFEARSGAAEAAIYKWLPTTTAAAVARAGYRGMTRGVPVVLPGISTKFLALAGQLSPARVGLEVNRLLLRKV